MNEGLTTLKTVYGDMLMFSKSKSILRK